MADDDPVAYVTLRGEDESTSCVLYEADVDDLRAVLSYAVAAHTLGPHVGAAFKLQDRLARLLREEWG